MEGVLAQDGGSKKSCNEKVLTYGDGKDKVMMKGDAPGEMDAAEKIGVFFYPILVKHEKESWADIGEAKDRLQAGTFGGEYQEGLKARFVQNLTK